MNYIKRFLLEFILYKNVAMNFPRFINYNLYFLNNRINNNIITDFSLNIISTTRGINSKQRILRFVEQEFTTSETIYRGK